MVLEHFELPVSEEPELKTWNKFLQRLSNPKNEVQIALVGKYVELKDSYKSIAEAFIHAGAENECKVNIKWVHSESLTTNNIKDIFSDVDGVLVAPGFGERGLNGKIEAIKYVRENNIPFLGICLGMQCAVIEYGRNVLNLEDCHSAEMKQGAINKVIDLMEEQKDITDKGGTMRLGEYKCQLEKNSLVYESYNSEEIMERHRHRFEFNNDYLEQYKEAGMVPAGINPDSELVEIVEIPKHPWFIGVQFHPEYKSTVANPHPLFVSFVAATVKHQKG